MSAARELPRIARVEVEVLRRRLEAPLATAHGPLVRRDGLWVRIHDETGEHGLGEAAPLPAFGTEPWERARAALDAARQTWPGRSCEALAAPESLDAVAGGAPTARFALESALAVLRARRTGLSLAAWLAREEAAAHGVGSGDPVLPRRRVPVHALIAEAQPGRAAEAAQRARAAGARALKLKVAHGPLEADLSRVAAVRHAAGPELELRLDANGGWSEDEARRALAQLALFAPAFVEQPVPAAQIEALARLAREGVVPVAADEALLVPEGPERVLALRAAQVLVLKPAALGGLAPAFGLARRARVAGMRCLVTSLLDGAVAELAVLHLAAALPGPLLACGLGSGPALEGDLVPRPRPRRGELAVPEGPGLGLALDPGLGRARESVRHVPPHGRCATPGGTGSPRAGEGEAG